MALDRGKYAGSVVSGARRGRGQVIGEALSGGRNVSGGSGAIDGSTPADGWRVLRKKTQARRQRPGGSDIGTQALMAAVVVGGGMLRLLVIGALAYIFRHDIHQLPYLMIAPVPLLLALWCGAGFGASAKSLRDRSLSAMTAAALGVGIGALLTGAGLYAWFVYIGIYPMSGLISIFNLPYATHEYLMLLDEGVFYLLGTLDRAVFAVVPLCGVALGWLFGRR